MWAMVSSFLVEKVFDIFVATLMKNTYRNYLHYAKLEILISISNYIKESNCQK